MFESLRRLRLKKARFAWRARFDPRARARNDNHHHAPSFPSSPKLELERAQALENRGPHARRPNQLADGRRGDRPSQPTFPRAIEDLYPIIIHVGSGGGGGSAWSPPLPFGHRGGQTACHASFFWAGPRRAELSWLVRCGTAVG